MLVSGSSIHPFILIAILLVSRMALHLIDRNFLYQVLFFLPSFLHLLLRNARAAGYDDDHAAHPLHPPYPHRHFAN